jgi:hypothetical protein
VCENEVAEFAGEGEDIVWRFGSVVVVRSSIVDGSFGGSVGLVCCCGGGSEGRGKRRLQTQD